MNRSPPRLEARRRLGCRTANELGAPVVSSTPEQLPGHEPVSARKGYEDGTAFLLRHRCCQGPLGRDGVAGGLCWSVVNDAAGWAELVAKLRGLGIAASGIEASGGYERGVVRALLAAGMSVRQINPFKLRQFAKACGVLAKNDRLDARMIALFVA